MTGAKEEKKTLLASIHEAEISTPATSVNDPMKVAGTPLEDNVSKGYNFVGNMRLNSLKDAILGYPSACSNVNSLTDWMNLNYERFGSPVLYADDMGTGVLFGYASAYAINKAMRAGLFIFGACFVTLQALSHYGFLTVNWEKMTHTIGKPLDVNNDGKFDQDDVKIMKDRLIKMLSRGLPSTAGFTLGFSWGLLRS